MTRRKRWILGSLAAVVGAVALGLFLLYRATQHVPPAYERALRLETTVAAERSDEMLRQATALSNRVKRPGRWEARFTDEQINGWLAVDLPRNHANALPASVSEPRVAIEEQRVTLFCRYTRGAAQSVLSLEVEPYCPSPNVLALRIRAAKAGRVPIPLDDLLRGITRAAQEADVPLQWRQADGDPVAILTAPPREANARQIRIDTLEIRSGELYVAGTTEPVAVGRGE